MKKLVLQPALHLGACPADRRSLSQRREAGGRKAHPASKCVYRRQCAAPRRYATITFRGNCSWDSRGVILSLSSSADGWTLPLASVTRETTVCSPGVAPSHR